ncbi:cell wall hydrolase/autolysin [Clostridium sp. CAG:288]|jgi:N-acetylmuramoyl-L-alanine amidase|nr:cell wall hydrolase/autolysin [Clostridium sp. CAG:288]
MKFKATTFIVTIGLLLFNASCVSKNNSSSDINISSSSDLIYTTSTLESSIEFNTSISSPQIISSSSSTSKPTSREKISIYLNPSVQTKNMYINNLGSEAENMRDIAELMYKELKLVSYIDIEANIAKNGLSLSQSVNQSNSRKRHIHFALHSNAGGGQGTEIYTKGSNKTFATTMYESFLELGNFKRRGVKDGTHLYEIKNVKADHVALIEFAFHDNLKEAKFIIENKALIANQMAKSILKYIDTYY